MHDAARILVIEDNETNLDLMVYLLQAFGYAPATAMDGQIGLDAARRERPDLIICDVHLPRVDGYGVVQQMKRDAELHRVPILAVTALAMLGDRDKMLAAGFDGYIAKPITPEEFVPQIEAYLPVKRRARSSRASASPAQPATEARPVAKRRATILVVDDTAANVEVARGMLEPSGYRVLPAATVREALAIAEADRPGLILCDHNMTPEGGRDLLDLAMAMPDLAGIPVVIISSTSSGDADRIACLQRGAARFISRPIEPAELLAEIESLLATGEAA